METYKDSESPLIKKIYNAGIKSYMAFPLISEDKVIGLLEFSSDNPNEFNWISAENLREIVPLFTIALQRSLNQYETQLEAIIQDQFTSLHPSVEWRFFEDAEKIYQLRQRDEELKLDEIVFNNVYPLYGQSDIRRSTYERNRAIQADLIEQLNLAEEVLLKALKIRPLPILDQLDHELKSCITHLTKDINAGDEVKILSFLKKEVYPVFNNLASEDDRIAKEVKKYEDALNTKLGVIYKKRKAYEDSVMQLNKIMSKHFEKAQREAQKMFPHYVESYKTDGLEHNIYIGQSLVKHKKFSEMYLQNLRLWQLITLVDIENIVQKKRKNFPVPLEIAS
ncbi:MAG: GAF domain-containing protein, partial [Bacteroidota bacterium]